MLLEWCKQVVKCPRQDDIVIHAAQRGDDNHAKAYTCSKITHILGKDVMIIYVVFGTQES